MQNLKTIARSLAIAAFQIEAIKIRPDNPFTWAAGWKSPIYNDNRLLLWHPDYRQLVTRGLMALIKKHVPDAQVIAGTSTAGIPWGSIVAEKMRLPFVYIRDEPKKHGMQNRIEGIAAEVGFSQEKVVVIEDLASTGKSSVDAVQAVRDAGGIVDYCFAIFSYGFPEVQKMFNAEIPYKGDNTLSTPCGFASILEYPLLLEVGIESNFIKKEHRVLLESWSPDPAGWSKRYKEANSE